jgi:hypothetical protein
MEVKLFVLRVEGKYYASGTIYTPNGIESYDDIFDSLEPIYSIRPTFATHIVVSPSSIKVTPQYYLTYDNVEDLKRMLSFMAGSPAEYLSSIPIDIVKELGIQLDKSEISFSSVRVPLSQSIPCNIIGSIYTPVVVSNNQIYFNNVQVGSILGGNVYTICGHQQVRYRDLEAELRLVMRKLLLCYLRETRKYYITWSDILRMWCGIKILLTT